MNQSKQLSGRLRPIKKRLLTAPATFVAVLTFPLLLSSCAQLSQGMGTPAGPTETAQPAPPPEPALPATVTAPSGGPASHESGGTGGPDTQPTHKAGAPPATITQPGGPDSKQAHDKAVAEKEQLKKDKKASVASDKKPAKKPSKPGAQPPSEDVFLPPVPLPSKPAAIGGSGG